MKQKKEHYFTPQKIFSEYKKDILNALNLKKPENQCLREKFQSAIFAYGVSLCTSKKLVLKLAENPPDFECGYLENNKFKFAKIENLSIPKFVRNETKNFSSKGLAKFIFNKKLKYIPSKYDKNYIFSIYMSFHRKNVRLEEINNELKKICNVQNEIWIYFSTSSDNIEWIITKIYPKIDYCKTFKINWC